MLLVDADEAELDDFEDKTKTPKKELEDDLLLLFLLLFVLVEFVEFEFVVVVVELAVVCEGESGGILALLSKVRAPLSH